MPEAAPVTPAAPAAAPKRFEIPVLAEMTPETIATPAGPVVPVAPAEGGAPAQDIGGQAPPATPEAKPEEAATPEQAAKREGRRFEKKLGTAYRKLGEAQARAEQAEKRLAELEKPKTLEGEPRLDQFDYDPEKYATAKADYARAQAGKDLEAKQRAENVKQQHQKLLSGWEEKVTRAEDKYDDFQETVGELQPNSPFIAAIMEAENGEDIAYHLGKHPKEAERIARLSPLSQVREIGKLEATLLAKPVTPKAPSKAPAPITPLSGAAPSGDSGSLDDMNMPDKEWLAKRNKQVHGKR